MLRYTSAVTFNDVPVLPGDKVVLSTQPIIFINLCRLYVSTDQDVKPGVLNFILLYVEIVSTEAQFIANFLWHESTIHFLLELVDARILIEL